VLCESVRTHLTAIQQSDQSTTSANPNEEIEEPAQITPSSYGATQLEDISENVILV
jgi:hypothetical protein